MRSGDGQNLGVDAGDIFRLCPQTARDDDTTVGIQGLANRLKALGLGTVQKPTGVDDHSFRPGIIGADGISFGAQAGQDTLTVDQRFGATKADHADGRLAGAGGINPWLGCNIGAQVWGVLCHGVPPSTARGV